MKYIEFILAFQLLFEHMKPKGNLFDGKKKNAISTSGFHETEFRFRFAGADSDSGVDSHSDSFNYMMFYMSVPPPFVSCSPKGTIMKIRSISDLYYAIPATVS